MILSFIKSFIASNEGFEGYHGFVYLYIPTFSREFHVTINEVSVRPEVVARTPQVTHGGASYGGQIIRVYLVITDLRLTVVSPVNSDSTTHVNQTKIT